MGTDLFEYEQQIYNDAIRREETIRNGVAFDIGEYTLLAMEYGRLLKQLRRGTRWADKTAFELYESNLDLTDKVHYDELTGIFNRRYMEENLKHIIKSMRLSGKGQLSVVMIDIDYFKKYNDTYGHGEGDVCLKAVAQTLDKSIKRAGDFSARYGGEEFVVVLPNTGEKGACAIAERMLKNVREMNIPHEKSSVASHVTISLGATTWDALCAKDGAGLIKRADEALYKSKNNGRDRYTYLDFEDFEDFEDLEGFEEEEK